MPKWLLYRWITNKYGAILGDGIRTKKPQFNNANRVARVLYRLGPYFHISSHMMKQGISIRHILRSQFPRVYPSHQAPLIVSLEFTNLCNLRCVYCTSPVSERARGFMDRATLDKVLIGIHQLGVQRVRIVGNGEATLHPEFGSYIQKLASATRFVSVVTNGQWRHPKKTISSLLTAPVRLVEVSVDSSTKQGYEQSRPGGKFERLIENLLLIKHEREKCPNRILVNLRLMVRPSERSLEKELTAFWSQFADTVMQQPVLERKTQPYVKDMYRPVQFDNHFYPTCVLPFKELIVNWDGDVPLCALSVQQVGAPGLIVGNVMTKTFDELWNHGLMRQYREGHQSRDFHKMEICKGCSGV